MFENYVSYILNQYESWKRLKSSRWTKRKQHRDKMTEWGILL